MGGREGVDVILVSEVVWRFFLGVLGGIFEVHVLTTTVGDLGRPLFGDQSQIPKSSDKSSSLSVNGRRGM